mmetsp:Transcript_3840/g.6039  ORF Transcript_3840/g.6039 Transcript_3840/m.6039 type:complete len:194 (-) Transcript_3840:309-890(-)
MSSAGGNVAQGLVVEDCTSFIPEATAVRGSMIGHLDSGGLRCIHVTQLVFSVIAILISLSDLLFGDPLGFLLVVAAGTCGLIASGAFVFGWCGPIIKPQSCCDCTTGAHILGLSIAASIITGIYGALLWLILILLHLGCNDGPRDYNTLREECTHLRWLLIPYSLFFSAHCVVSAVAASRTARKFQSSFTVLG